MLLSKKVVYDGNRDEFYLGFNPYFSGCFSLSPNIRISVRRCQKSFNPYFSGCFSLRVRNTLRRSTEGVFQSLFFWMLLSKVVIMLVCLGDRGQVSILIFLDASL